ncbi:MAG: prepilin peptidase [Hyphomicrobiaceae bacterium]|nr:prepilin peptidase [Hyphomicrobiaceae bacterium]
MSIVNSIALLLFPLAMVFAAISDTFTMRITNKLVLGLMAAFVMAAALSGLGLAELGWHLAAGAVVLVAAFSFFAFGWIGGGDAKFAAATALWLGFGTLVPYLIYSALLGGALTLFLLGLRRFPLPAQLVGVDWINRLHHPKTGIPYGIALAVAGLIVYPATPLFKALIG